MIRILFLLRSLEIGGAERQVVELIRHIDHTRFDILVVTFYNDGALRPFLANIPAVRVTSVGKHNRWDLFSFSFKLLKIIQEFKPAIIQSYLDVPNSFNVLADRLLGVKTSLGASAAYMDFSRYDWTAAVVYKTGAFLSRFSNKVIANSNAGEKYNIEHGYDKTKLIVIHNGIDTQSFHPDKSERSRLRSQWGIGEHEKIAGIVGRLDPMKDHPTFLRAAALVLKEFPDCRFVCVGRGNQIYQEEMKTLAASLMEANKVLWIHDCADQDMPAAYNVFDILVSSSYGEGLPVVLGEGMSSGVACVVTDVGDSAFAVGQAGLVVAPQNPVALAKAIAAILEMDDTQRSDLGAKGRSRVQDFFSIEKMTAAYETVFQELIRK